MDNAGLNYIPGAVNTSDLGYHTNAKGDRERHPDKSDSANEWYYKKQEAELNHRYEADAALRENQMMVDQWNRENEYNDPRAVAARYRAAGINPRAAFGTGSASGAGLAAHSNVGDVGAGTASGTYGKSGLTQGIENARNMVGMVTDAAGQSVGIAKSIGGLINMSADTTQKRTVTQGMQIENRYKEQKILTELTKERTEIDNILNDSKLKESERVFYEKRLDQIDQEIKESEQRIKESGQRITESNQNISESQAREGKAVSESRKIDAETSVIKFQDSFTREYGFRPGDGWSAVLASIYVRSKNTEKKVGNVLRSSETRQFFKDLFMSDYSLDDSKLIMDAIESKSPEDAKKYVEKMLEKQKYNQYLE